MQGAVSAKHQARPQGICIEGTASAVFKLRNDEKKALILRARAELAKIASQYAKDPTQRERHAKLAQTYEAQVQELETRLEPWAF